MTTSTQTKLRGGTKTDCDAMTPADREVIVDTTKKRARVGDGARPGGFEIPNFDDVQCQAMIAAAAGGTADAITVTLAPQPLAWTAFLSGVFKASGPNTITGVTMEITGLAGTKTVKKKGKTGKVALAIGDIQPDVIYRWNYDGTDVQLEAVDLAPPSGLVKLKTLDFAAASTADFTSLIAAGYAEHSWIIENLTFSTDNSSLYLLTSADNGSTWATAANSYRYNYDEYAIINGTDGSHHNPATPGDVQIIMAINIGNAAAEGLSGKIEATGLLGTTRKKIFRIKTEWQDTATQDTVREGHGVRLSTSAVNAIRFKPSAGTFTGKIHMYGIAI